MGGLALRRLWVLLILSSIDESFQQSLAISHALRVHKAEFILTIQRLTNALTMDFIATSHKEKRCLHLNPSTNDRSVTSKH